MNLHLDILKKLQTETDNWRLGHFWILNIGVTISTSVEILWVLILLLMTLFILLFILISVSSEGGTEKEIAHVKYWVICNMNTSQFVTQRCGKSVTRTFKITTLFKYCDGTPPAGGSTCFGFSVHPCARRWRLLVINMAVSSERRLCHAPTPLTKYPVTPVAV